MYIVVESYDGEVNITPCANIESARYAKKQYQECIDNFNYETVTDTENYFSAEINEMLYEVEIRNENVLDINIL